MTDAVNSNKQHAAVLIGGNVQTKAFLDHAPGLKDGQNTSMPFAFSPWPRCAAAVPAQDSWGGASSSAGTTAPGRPSLAVSHCSG